MSYTKGTVTSVTRFTPKDIMNVSGNYSIKSMDPQSEQSLRRFLEFCSKMRLENIVFVRYPHIIQTDKLYERFQRCNEAERIIKEYGFDFINLERDNETIGLNYTEDFYNEDHVYLTGQRKLTEYLGRILVENYGVTPRKQSEENRKKWEISVKYNQLFFEYCEELRSQGAKGARYETRDVVERLTEMGKERGLW